MGHLQPPGNRNPRVMIFNLTSLIVFIPLVAHPEFSAARGVHLLCAELLLYLLPHRMSSSKLATDQPGTQLHHDSTLVLDNAVSLTLSSDSLLVVGRKLNCAPTSCDEDILIN